MPESSANHSAQTRRYLQSSGMLYLPFEIVKVIERPNMLHVGIFVGNLGIVLYMLYIRVRAYRMA